MEAKAKTGMTYKIKYNCNVILHSGEEQKIKTSNFMLNKEKKVTGALHVLQKKINGNTEITSELIVKTNIELELELEEVSVTLILNNNDYYHFNLNSVEYKNFFWIFTTQKSYNYLNNVTCYSCGENIPLMKNDLKITEFVVTYNFLNDHSNEKLQLLKNVYLSGDYSDMTITIDNLRKFNAHKIVLASNSKVFKKMIDFDMKEKNTSNINLTDIEISVFEEAFKFMYIKSCDLSKSPHEIFKFAHLYEIHYLQDECSRYLLNNIKFDNIIDTLKLIDVDAYELHELKVEVNKFINKNENKLVVDNNYIKYHLDYMRPNNVHYIFCLAMRYNLHEVSEKVKNFIKQNIKDVLKNKDFENLMYKNPGWAYDIMTFCLIKNDEN